MIATKEYLKHLLQTTNLRIKFKKKDGTEREMLCTLQADALPSIKEKREEESSSKPKKENDEVLAVWDIEKEAFRSFRIESLLSLREEL